MATSPFVINIHSNTYGEAFGANSRVRPIGTIRNSKAIDATFGFNRNGTVQIRLKASDQLNKLMMHPDTYADVFYRGKREMTGKIRTKQGSFMPNGDRVYQVRDDRAILDDVLAYVKPLGDNNFASAPFPTGLGAAGEGQWVGTVPNQLSGDLTGAIGYYDWAHSMVPASPPWPFNGLPANTESAIRKIYFENMLRLNGPEDIRGILSEVNQNRGLPFTLASQLPNVRFNKLSDIINPLALAAGLGVRILRDHGEHMAGDSGNPYWGQGVGLWLDIYSPREWRAPLTAASGVIVEPSTWVISDPIATRGLVGGPGDLAMRHLVEFGRSGVSSSAEERRIGWISEAFRDATNVQLVWPDSLAEALRVAAYYMFRPEVAMSDKQILANAMNAAADAVMRDGAASSGLSITLAETPGFHYGGAGTDAGIQLGDIVTVKDPSGLEFRDRLTEVTISWTRAGTKVTPKVGNREGDTTRSLYDKIAQLAASQRKVTINK